jgi:hypothetical protein
MLASRPIEVQGRFLGVAVTHESAWRFVAVHPSVRDIDGTTFASPAEAGRVAGLVFAGGRAHGRANPPERLWHGVRCARMHARASDATHPASVAAPGGGAAP